MTILSCSPPTAKSQIFPTGYNTSCAHRVSTSRWARPTLLGNPASRRGGEFQPTPVLACKNNAAGQRAEREVRMRKDAGAGARWWRVGKLRGLKGARKWRIVGFAVRFCVLL